MTMRTYGFVDQGVMVTDRFYSRAVSAVGSPLDHVFLLRFPPLLEAVGRSVVHFGRLETKDRMQLQGKPFS